MQEDCCVILQKILANGGVVIMYDNVYGGLIKKGEKMPLNVSGLYAIQFNSPSIYLEMPSCTLLWFVNRR